MFRFLRVAPVCAACTRLCAFIPTIRNTDFLVTPFAFSTRSFGNTSAFLTFCFRWHISLVYLISYLRERLMPMAHPTLALAGAVRVLVSSHHQAASRSKTCSALVLKSSREMNCLSIALVIRLRSFLFNPSKSSCTTNPLNFNFAR